MANSYNTMPIVITTPTPGAAITGITETGTTATVATGTVAAGQSGTYVNIYGENVTGYNGLWLVGTVVANTSFTITAPSGLGTATGGFWYQGWRSLQTLNTGFLPTNAQQPYQQFRQPGLFVTAVIWTGATSAAHTFSIIDPANGTMLLQGTAGTNLADNEYIFDNGAVNWRDFAVTTIQSGTLQIFYR